MIEHIIKRLLTIDIQKDIFIHLYTHMQIIDRYVHRNTSLELTRLFIKGFEEVHETIRNLYSPYNLTVANMHSS